MEILSKAYDVEGLTVRFRRMGAISYMRYQREFREAQGNEERCIEISVQTLAGVVHSLDGVTLNGEPASWPADSAGRVDFLDSLGVVVVNALIQAATDHMTPSESVVKK